MKLLRYHLLDDDSCADDVKKGLEQKMNIMVERELYTKSKTALTEEEREKADKSIWTGGEYWLILDGNSSMNAI